jgi:hypothetical protein
VDVTSLSTTADQLLHGQSVRLGDSTASLTFGQGNDFREATIAIGPIAGGNMTQITINFPQPINPQVAVLQQLLYHHESATIFANRLENFVGREAEIAEIRQRIAQLMPTGGYVTITAQAGEGKSSVIAQMISQDGPDQTAFHFIALTPGREYQLSLLRPIVARLILKHGLPITYFPDTSYPAMRDYFHSVLRLLSERGVQEVIYLDGLDQLDAEAAGTRDLSFLPTSPPPGMVLVLGTRPDDTLQPLEGKKVQVEYRLPHLSYPDFQQLLAERNVVTEPAHRLYTALQGNAFYLALVVQELKDGPIADLDAFVERISDNPDNLFGLTIERLQRDDAQWEQVLERVLGLLLVAQEPLDRATIRNLLEVSDVRLRRGLGQLGGLVAQDVNGRYFLYHLKVRDYLAEDVAQPDKSFVVSQEQIVDWHTTLAQWCVVDAKDIERIWEDATGAEHIRRVYARHHYVTHVALGQHWDGVCQDIDDGLYGRHKRRFDPSTHLYAQDLDRVRDMAVQRQDIIHLWRWSLLRTSLTSKIDAWPDALFRTLVLLGRTREALSRIELVSDVAGRVRLFCQAALLLTADDAAVAWQRAQVTAHAIPNVQTRTNMLHLILQAVASIGDFAQAQTIVPSIPTEEGQATAHILLIQALAAEVPPDSDVFTQCRILAEAIPTVSDRVTALSTLALRMASVNHSDAAALFKQVLSLGTAIPDDQNRDAALATLVQALANAGDVLQAYTISESIRSDWVKADALQSVIQAFANAGDFIQAQTIAEAIRSDWIRVRVLSILAEAMTKVQHPDAPALFTQAQTIAASIDSDWVKSDALQDVMRARAHAGYVDDATAIATSIVDEDERDTALRILVQTLATTSQFAEACTIAKTILDDQTRATALQVVIQALVNVGDFEQAQTLAHTLPTMPDQVAALSTLVVKMASFNPSEATTLFTQIRMMADSIAEDTKWDQGLRSLVEHIASAGDVPQASTFAERIIDPSIRASALRSVVQSLISARDFAQASTIAQSIPVAAIRASVLGFLAQAMAVEDHLGALTILNEALRIAKTISTDWLRADTLTTLAQVMAAVNHPDTAMILTQARSIAASIADEGDRGSVLMNLVHALARAGDFTQAYTVAMSLLEASDRVDVLAVLVEAMHAGHHPDAGAVFTEALAMVEIVDNTIRTAALGTLMWCCIRMNTFTQAYAVTEKIPLPRDRVIALSNLAKAMTAVQDPAASAIFVQARTIAEAIHDPEMRQDALRSLAQCLAATADVDQALSIAQDIPHAVMQQDVFRVVVQAFARAGNFTQAYATADAIADPVMRAESFTILAHAMAAVDHPDTRMIAEQAWTAAEMIPHVQIRAEMLHNLYVRRDVAQDNQSIIDSICRVWRRAPTRAELLTLFPLIAPRIVHNPTFGQALLDSFTWVDDQLREE